MKELVGKIKLKPSNLPRRITVSEVDIFDERKIVSEFNAFFYKHRDYLNNPRILDKQSRFYHGNKTTLDE